MDLSPSPERMEKIAEFACKFFQQSIPKQGKPLAENNEWTTMASIIQSNVNDSNAMKCVAVGTGTKCLGQNELSRIGDLVSDSHAEVIARRSFQLYLYDQITQSVLERPSVLEHYKSSEGFQMCKLKENVEFHMFISHIPCGDAAIFDVVDHSDSNEDDVPAKKQKLHRTGAKLSERLYEDIQCIGKCRIKPGKGDPTLSMSCSDKLAKWQILGLQGSLLSNFIPTPITLSSVIIGSSVEFSSSSLRRAVYSRFHSQLKSELRNEHRMPGIFQSCRNFMEFPQDGKPAPASILGFSSSDGGTFLVEVSVNGRKQGVTKKNFCKPAARVRICRKKLLEQFVNLVKIYEEKGLPFKFTSSPDWTYAAVKKLSSDYNERWEYLKREVMLGWTLKPENLQSFTIS